MESANSVREPSNPQVELTAKQRSRCLVPVTLRVPAAAHLQRWAPRT